MYALAVSVAKDALDLLVDAGYLVTVGELAILGIPFLIILDFVVAFILWTAFGKNWLVLPVAVFEAVPGVQSFPTWTAFTLLMIARGGKVKL